MHHLPAPRPVRRCQALRILRRQPTLGHRRGTLRRTLALTRRRHWGRPLPGARQRHRQRRIQLLVLARQAQGDALRPCIRLPRPHHPQRSADGGGLVAQRRRRVLPLRHRKGRHARLEDAGLLGGDLGQRVPQQLHVVEAQGGDAAHDGAAHAVGGVQPPAQPHFQHHDIHPLLQEDLEAWGRWVRGRERWGRGLKRGLVQVAPLTCSHA
jgi:hypothetical protein